MHRIENKIYVSLKKGPTWMTSAGCPVVKLLTCVLHQNGSALHPGPGGVVAVTRPAAVVPRLLWAELGQKQRSTQVGRGALGVSSGLWEFVGLLVPLGRQRIVVEEPDHVGERPPAEPAAESGGSQFWVGSVEVLNVHRHLTSHWDWRGGGSTDHRPEVAKCLHIVMEQYYLFLKNTLGHKKYRFNSSQSKKNSDSVLYK